MRFIRPKGAIEPYIIAVRFANLMNEIDPNHEQYPEELFSLEYWLEHQPEMKPITYKKAEEVFLDV